MPRRGTFQGFSIACRPEDRPRRTMAETEPPSWVGLPPWTAGALRRRRRRHEAFGSPAPGGAGFGSGPRRSSVGAAGRGLDWRLARPVGLVRAAAGRVGRQVRAVHRPERQAGTVHAGDRGGGGCAPPGGERGHLYRPLREAHAMYPRHGAGRAAAQRRGGQGRPLHRWRRQTGPLHAGERRPARSQSPATDELRALQRAEWGLLGPSLRCWR